MGTGKRKSVDNAQASSKVKKPKTKKSKRDATEIVDSGADSDNGAKTDNDSE